MDKTRPKLDEELCSRCGLCISACPCGSVELEQESVHFSCPESCSRIEINACDCGCLCEEVCPTGAISVAFDIVLDEGEKPENSKGQAHGAHL